MRWQKFWPLGKFEALCSTLYDGKDTHPLKTLGNLLGTLAMPHRRCKSFWGHVEVVVPGEESDYILCVGVLYSFGLFAIGCW